MNICLINSAVSRLGLFAGTLGWPSRGVGKEIRKFRYLPPTLGYLGEVCSFVSANSADMQSLRDAEGRQQNYYELMICHRSPRDQALY